MMGRGGMRNSSRVAKGGMLAGLAFVIMWSANLFPTLSYTLAAAASVCVMVAVIELGRKYAFVVYAASAILTALLAQAVPDTAVMYIAIFGHYPIVKSWLENRSMKRSVEWAAKYVAFDLSLAVACAILIWVLRIPPEGGWWMALALILFANVGFFLYDRLLSILATQYVLRFKNKL